MGVFCGVNEGVEAAAEDATWKQAGFQDFNKEKVCGKAVLVGRPYSFEAGGERRSPLA